MTMAVTVLEWLLEDAGIGDQIDSERWYGASAVVDTPVRPFAVLRYLSSVRLGGGKDVYPLMVSVHDDPGSYMRINLINSLIVPRMKALEQFVGSGGTRVVQADYLGLGGEETDPEKGTIYRTTSWQLAVPQ